MIIPPADNPTNGNTFDDIIDMMKASGLESDSKQVFSSNSPQVSSMEWLLKPHKEGSDRLLLLDPYVNGYKSI